MLRSVIRGRLPAVVCACGVVVGTGAVEGQETEGARELTAEHLDQLSWRSLGPANMGGRVAALAFVPGEWKSWYVGYATGSLWKTTNAGTTYAPVFEHKETSSIGSVEVASAPADWPGWDEAENPVSMGDREEAGVGRIVWVGTGEGNGRNSSSWGHGVYRSTDAGASFEYVGLADAHDIPALAVDPRDPDVCYVAALGHLWGPNETRGVYKTTDGGESWDAVLRIDEDTGACDVKIDPSDPETVYAAMYMRRRSIWSYQSGGERGGIFRSRDGGETWEKLTDGLPEQTGRIGLAVYPQDPDILLAVVESDVGGKVAEAFNDRSRAGGVFRSEDGGDTWERLGDYNPRAFYFSRIYFDPTNDQRVYLLGWQVYVSDDGGRNFRAGMSKVTHVDNHALVINPENRDHLILGNDGGVYVSYDRGKTWDFHNHMAVGQFYNVEVDDSDPYRVGGGLQDNGTWIGLSDTRLHDGGGFMGRRGGNTNNDWRFVMGGDGFHVDFDPSDPNVMYAEWQGGNLYRLHLDTNEMRYLKPAAKEGEPRFRFNWNAPFFVSPHDPSVLYLGGNVVFRLDDRGEAWTRISPDLSRLSRENPLAMVTEGSQAETGATAVALAESPLQAGLLWAGTDDGLIHLTRDGGETWRDVTPPEVGGYYVSRIEPSAHDVDTAYAAIDGHRSDFFEPIMLITTNGGDSWREITGDLPRGAPPEVIREDPHNPDVLYVGTEQACYVTIDRGRNWVELGADSLPTVPVDDLKIQQREMDLVAGTHGRSIWILDDTSCLSGLTPEIVASDFHVFEPLSARPHVRGPYGGLWSDKMFIGQNPEWGAYIAYWLGERTEDPIKVSIANSDGVVVRELTGTDHAGINRVVWDLQASEDQRLGNADQMPEFVPAGVYAVKVMGGDELSGAVEIEVLEAESNSQERSAAIE